MKKKDTYVYFLTYIKKSHFYLQRSAGPVVGTCSSRGATRSGRSKEPADSEQRAHDPAVEGYRAGNSFPLERGRGQPG